MWTENDPQMWREQCRIGDVAFQHLFCASKGKPLPDWVMEGLPKMYQLLSEHNRHQEALKLLTEILEHQIANRGTPSAFYRCYTYSPGEMPPWVKKVDELIRISQAGPKEIPMACDIK